MIMNAVICVIIIINIIIDVVSISITMKIITDTTIMVSNNYTINHLGLSIAKCPGSYIC